MFAALAILGGSALAVRHFDDSAVKQQQAAALARMTKTVESWDSPAPERHISTINMTPAYSRGRLEKVGAPFAYGGGYFVQKYRDPATGARYYGYIGKPGMEQVGQGEAV